MTPYHEEEAGKIYLGDCLEVMREIPDNSVDLVLTDPPYGISYTRHIQNKRYDEIDNDNNLDWLENCVRELHRLLKDDGNGYMFCSWHNVEVFKKEINRFFTVRNMLIWDKGGCGMGDLETTYGSVYEICLFFNRTPQKLFGKRDSDILRTRRTGNNFHPTEKPTDLMKFLIEKSTEENDLVLDPFAGSGSTLFSAKQLKRNFIGIEISEKYCEIAKGRLRQDTLL